MKNKFILALIYIIIFFNSNLLSDDDNKILKVGLLAPLSGSYSELGNSLLYSLQMALEELDDKEVFIIPRDSGFNNKDKLDEAIQSIRSQGAKVIIGPITHEEFDIAKKYNDLIFISPSNINPEFSTIQYNIYIHYINAVQSCLIDIYTVINSSTISFQRESDFFRDGRWTRTFGIRHKTFE